MQNIFFKCTFNTWSPHIKEPTIAKCLCLSQTRLLELGWGPEEGGWYHWVSLEGPGPCTGSPFLHLKRKSHQGKGPDHLQVPPCSAPLFANYVHTINVLHESHFMGNLQEMLHISNEEVQINELVLSSRQIWRWKWKQRKKWDPISAHANTE